MAPSATPGAPTALPSSTVTPSVTPTPADPGTTTTPGPRTPAGATGTPRATPASANEVPGELGALPAGFKLPDEDRPGDPEVSAFTTTVWRATCADGSTIELPPLDTLTASRVKESIGPEHVQGHGLLVFSDADAAASFLSAVASGLQACAPDGPATDGTRMRQSTGPTSGLGDAGVQVGTWSQYDMNGTWTDAPGAGLQFVVREGRHVAVAFEGGEFVGDPTRLPEASDRGRRAIEAILAQV